MGLERAVNIADLRRIAARRLPRPVFDYLDGGADDEKALQRSSAAFADYEILPRALVDISTRSFGTTLFGCPVAWPILLAPTGLTRLFHSDAESAVARAAARHGVGYCLSTLGTTTIEDFGRSAPAPRLFQVYIFKDRGLTAEMVARARAAGYDGLVLTVDTVTGGNRERDVRNGFALPPRLTLRSALDYAMHPFWSIPALSRERFDFVNVSHQAGARIPPGTSLIRYVAEQFDPGLTWSDVEWLGALWQGPLAVKGVMTASDARRAADSGASAVMISNHGGRQLDEAPAPIDCIAAVADAVSDRLEVICDGGVRRGADVVKALALGATACSIGRPYLYGLAAGGEAGVGRALSILRAEFERTMVLAGAASPSMLDRDMIAVQRVR